MRKFYSFVAGLLLLALSLIAIQKTLTHRSSDELNIKTASIFYIVTLETKPIAVTESDWKVALEHSVIGKLVSAELARCKQKKKNCLMPFYKHGTAFLMGSSGDLWSAAHLFEDQLLDELDKNKVRNKETFAKTVLNFQPKFLLLDANLKVVFDSRTASRLPKSIFLGDPFRFEDLLREKYSSRGFAIGNDGKSNEYLELTEFRKRFFDFIHIRMPENLNHPSLSVAQDSSFSQKDIYVAGPEKIMPAQRRSNCFLGIGDLIKMREDSYCKFLGDFFINYYPALKEGTSGSPVLSKEGEVLGIHVASGESDSTAINLRWAKEVISYANSAGRSL